MRCKLEFELPGEAEDLRMAQQGADFHGVLCDLDDWLRILVKLANDRDERVVAYEDVRARLQRELSERGVEL